MRQDLNLRPSAPKALNNPSRALCLQAISRGLWLNREQNILVIYNLLAYLLAKSYFLGSSLIESQYKTCAKIAVGSLFVFIQPFIAPPA